MRILFLVLLGLGVFALLGAVVLLVGMLLAERRRKWRSAVLISEYDMRGNVKKYVEEMLRSIEVPSPVLAAYHKEIAVGDLNDALERIERLTVVRGANNQAWVEALSNLKSSVELVREQIDRIDSTDVSSRSIAQAVAQFRESLASAQNASKSIPR